MTEKSADERFNQKFRKNKKSVFVRNKLFFFRIPAILFVLYLSLCPIKSVLALQLSTDEQAYLRSKGTIVFVSQTRYPPFEFIYQSGEHTGMCIELARWMATEFGFTAKFTDTYFKQAQQDILTSKVDVLTSFFYSKKRDESFDFTQLMFEVPASIFVVAERTDIKDIQDLNGKRIAMQAGDYAKEFLELKGIKFDIVYSKNFAEATDLVIAGKADAIIGDEQIVLYHIFQDNLTGKIKKVGDPLYIGQNCMATKEGNQMLISILNKGIKLAQKTGVLEKINRKWIGTHYNSNELWLFKYLPHLYVTVGAIFVLALLSWTWNVRLRQAVKERTEQLQKSEEKYRELAEFLPQPVFELDIKGNFIYSNRCGLITFGYTLDDIEKGVNALQLFIPEERERVQQNIQKRLSGEDFEYHEYTGLRKDGSTIPILIYSVPVIHKGKAVGVRGIVVDISERKRAEEKIVLAKEEWESTFNSVPDLIAIIDDKYRMVRVNKAMADKLDVTPDEAVGLSCYEHIHGTKEPPPFCPHKKLLLDGQEHVAEIYENRLGGIFQVSVTPFHDNDGKLIGSVHMARDITEQKRAEKALATERRRLADILEGTNVGTWEWNVQTGETIFNEQWARIIGYTLEEISPVSIDTWIKFAHPDDLKMSDELLEKHFSGELDYYECEARMRHKNGDWVWVLDRGKVATWTEDGKPLLMSGTHQDITERKRSEQQVKASLKEKEILLREIHHRVKNNLAVISSLLSMQANIVSDRQVHTALQESQNRVKAMALIHETLHQSESLALIDLGNYVKDLVGNIVNTFEGISGRINFEIEVPDVKLEINQAVPCGLIINELATNAIKHAFIDGQNGVVKINAKYTEDNKIELKVNDNGVGFSEELDWIKSKSLGLRLIALLVDQLHGTLDIKNFHGTQATIRWPLQTI